MLRQVPRGWAVDVADLLGGAVDALYAALPEEFMALRKRLVAAAKDAHDKGAAAEIGRLRKPSLAAWAVNLAARGTPAVVADLVDVGTRMRVAQSHLDTATLTTMRPERDSLIAAWVEAAREAVAAHGRQLSPAAEQEVRATVIAALADEAAAEAVVSGALTRSLSYSGFGEVDLSEAVVRTSSGSVLTVLPSGSRKSASSRPERPGRASEEPADQPSADAPETPRLEEELAAAEAELARAQDEVAAAREHAEQTRERLAVVERQLTKAREADERALEAVTDAVRARKQAEATRHTAQEALEEARRRS